MPIRHWPDYAEHAVASLRRSSSDRNMPVGDTLGAICVNYSPDSAGNEARDIDLPRRLGIRAQHSWNPAVTDVIVNT
jgi:hypothetical protein